MSENELTALPATPPGIPLFLPLSTFYFISLLARRRLATRGAPIAPPSGKANAKQAPENRRQKEWPHRGPLVLVLDNQGSEIRLCLVFDFPHDLVGNRLNEFGR